MIGTRSGSIRSYGCTISRTKFPKGIVADFSGVTDRKSPSPSRSRFFRISRVDGQYAAPSLAFVDPYIEEVREGRRPRACIARPIGAGWRLQDFLTRMIALRVRATCSARPRRAAALKENPRVRRSALRIQPWSSFRHTAGPATLRLKQHRGDSEIKR